MINHVEIFYKANQRKWLMINHVENFIKSTTENDNPVKMINAMGKNLISTKQNDNPVKWLMVLKNEKIPTKWLIILLGNDCTCCSESSTCGTVSYVLEHLPF